VGDVSSGFSLAIFVQVTRPWVLTARGNFLTQIFSGN